jgi:hypothetical protein
MGVAVAVHPSFDQQTMYWTVTVVQFPNIDSRAVIK